MRNRNTALLEALSCISLAFVFNEYGSQLPVKLIKLHNDQHMLFSVTARQILRKPVGPIDEKDFKHVEDAFFPGVLDLIIVLVKVAFFFF